MRREIVLTMFLHHFPTHNFGRDVFTARPNEVSTLRPEVGRAWPRVAACGQQLQVWAESGRNWPDAAGQCKEIATQVL